MCELTDWYFVARERFSYDLSLPMPYSIIKKYSNLEPVLIGKINGMKVIIDNIKNFNEMENILIIDDYKNKNLKFGKINKDFYELQSTLIKGYSIIYNWAIDADLNITGVIFDEGSFKTFTDVIETQNENIIFLKNSRKKVFIVWSTMSAQQREYMNTLNEKELLLLASGENFEVKNCKLNLSLIIKNKEEREKNNHLLEKIDVPKWMR